jgi:hypothetical protein
VRDTLVDGEKDVELSRRSAEKFAVAEAVPAQFLNCVITQLPPQASWYAFVKQQTH